ncbi:13796_t:CDS:2 [Entrophospora sp. SA101]|nr:13796_t:CDS:2 [Entrophospora sp. SA101]
MRLGFQNIPSAFKIKVSGRRLPDAHEIIDKNVDSVDNDDNLEYLKLFSFDLNIYPWILKKFGPSSIVTSTCYNEILSTKFHFDNQNRWYYEDLTDKGWIAKLANLEKSSAKSPCSDIILFK